MNRNLERDDYLTNLPNWVRLVDLGAEFLVWVLLAGGFFSEAYAVATDARGLAWLGCALLGCWGLLGFALGRWRGASRRPLLAFLAVLGIALLWTGFQILPMPAGLVLALSPPWKEVAASFAEADIDLPQSLTIAVNPARAVESWHQIAAMCGFFLGAGVLATRRAASRRMFIAILVLVVGEALWGIQSFGLEGELRASGAAYNPNHHAAIILMGLPLLLAAPFHLNRQWTSLPHGLWSGRNPLLILFFAAIIAILSWMASLSRASAIIGIAVLAGWIAIEWLGSRRAEASGQSAPDGRWRLAGLWAGILGIVLVLVIVESSTVPEGFAGRSGKEEVWMDRGRMEIWSATMQAFGESPVLGLGQRGTENYLMRYIARPSEKVPVWSHNDYAQVLAEAGVLGSLLLLIGIAGVIWCLRREMALRCELFVWEERLLVRAAGAGLVTVLLHSAVDFPLRIPLIGFQFLLMSALVLGPGGILAGMDDFRE